MKKLKTAAELAEAFTLSDLGVPETPRVTAIAGKRLMVEGHRGLLEFGNEHIVLSARRCKLHVYGSGMRLCAMSSDTLIIFGQIGSVEFE